MLELNDYIEEIEGPGSYYCRVMGRRYIIEVSTVRGELWGELSGCETFINDDGDEGLKIVPDNDDYMFKPLDQFPEGEVLTVLMEYGE